MRIPKIALGAYYSSCGGHTVLDTNNDDGFEEERIRTMSGHHSHRKATNLIRGNLMLQAPLKPPLKPLLPLLARDGSAT